MKVRSTISECLAKYEKEYGQLVNYDKSVLAFLV